MLEDRDRCIQAGGERAQRKNDRDVLDASGEVMLYYYQVIQAYTKKMDQCLVNYGKKYLPIIYKC